MARNSIYKCENTFILCSVRGIFFNLWNIYEFHITFNVIFYAYLKKKNFVQCYII